jgi:hypothetical protein
MCTSSSLTCSTPTCSPAIDVDTKTWYAPLVARFLLRACRLVDEAIEAALVESFEPLVAGRPAVEPEPAMRTESEDLAVV